MTLETWHGKKPERWSDQRIKIYNADRDCECGNGCYLVVGGNPGHFLVEWSHAPADCPYGCEDCEQEAE